MHPHLELLVAEVDAEFAYLLDVPTREGRHWENDGSLEGIATGSAAGAVGASLAASGLAAADATIVLRPGAVPRTPERNARHRARSPRRDLAPAPTQKTEAFSG